ncbi:NAD(P)H-dependent oxidoreductase [Pontibacter roseus]|uniref:NAD(P)H-dependent oxidoreductase n=1 Tax=Pontibacter roseus TaxID=336989 RepID=UPI0003751CC9|nr:Gfo/Idh/MocA family oxidoreductase [Pontibacter roseus]
MIIIDTALAKREAEGRPVRVGMVGAGFMAKGVALQIAHHVPGMELVAISNRTIERAKEAYTEAGIAEVEEVASVTALEENIRNGRYSITEDASLLCQAEGIDAILEVTGAVEFGTRIALDAINHGKHIIMMDAEVDGTVGPILKVYADKAGVVFTNVDGDQPGVIMNLYRYVKSIGMKPVLCGNIKGLHDPYRNPTTQEGFAKRWGQNPAMVTSFADGTKISFEQAIVANGTGMRVAKRGMMGPYAPQGANIRESVNLFPLEELTEGPGIVDYVVGIAEPAGGVFVLATQDNARQQHYLNYYKMGEGPLYCFYTPYHLCHLEVPLTIARAVLFNDAALTPLDRPYVDVVTAAKIDLKAGQSIDGIGHYMTYGLCENADVTERENLLPIGVAEGCVLKRDVPKDQVLTYDDVVLPEGRIVDQLREEQRRYFASDLAAAAQKSRKETIV